MTASSDKIILLDPDKLVVDGGTQSRAALNSDTVEEYKEDISKGDEFPPCVAFWDGSHYWLASGFHTRLAYKALKRKDLRVMVQEGTVRDAILFSVGTNAKHGLRRTVADRRHACRLLLVDDEWGHRSDHDLADICNVSRYLMRKVREELAEEAEAAKRREEEKRQRKAEQDAEHDRQAAEQQHAALTDFSSENGSSKHRTYTTRHGTEATMDTSRIGRTKRKLEVVTDPGERQRLWDRQLRLRRKWKRNNAKLGLPEDVVAAAIDRGDTAPPKAIEPELETAETAG